MVITEEIMPSNSQLRPVTETKIDELLAQMTLEEKVGQLVQIGLNVSEVEAKIKAGQVGSLLSSFDAGQNNKFQRIAVEESRLGIPLLVGNDVIHGYRTIFPIPLAQACSWEPDLVEQAAKIAAQEAATAGTSWIYTPMVDVSRDPRWGRVAEGAGEDPFLGIALAQAQVRGIQTKDLPNGWRIVACPKHYVAYGAVESGREYNIVDVSERTLRDIYLPPFKAAFEAGAGSVMSAFNEISGVPASANSFTLKTVLRDEFGFEGVVVSDYNAVGELIDHGVAADLKDAARLGMLAGIDVDMMSHAYSAHLAELVKEGAVPVEVLDRAVRRVLQLKWQLGLFEKPYTDETLAKTVILRPDFRALAREMTQKSMVLLKNDGNVLPLANQGQRLALIGPLADNRTDLLGCWAGQGQPEDVVTVLEGIKAYLGEASKLVYVPGCSIEDASEPDFTAALEAAKAADVVIVALGESAAMSGEAHSRAYLGLPGRQQELLDALHATGKPLVGVLMCGRPLAIPQMARQVAALLLAWHGGVEAGNAVADLLFGKANPSGKLSMSFPWTEGQIPVYYAQKNTGRPASGAGVVQFVEEFKSRYMDVPNTPLFAFGYGLSYTSFSYSDLIIETPEVASEGTLVASAVVTNTGQRAGDEIVQLYVRDLVGSVTRPVKELKGFQRLSLQPGEARKVRFEIPVKQLGCVGADMRYKVEPGDFKLWLGPASTNGLAGEFRVI
jgi:beta-glucosidase